MGDPTADRRRQVNGQGIRVRKKRKQPPWMTTKKAPRRICHGLFVNKPSLPYMSFLGVRLF